MYNETYTDISDNSANIGYHIFSFKTEQSTVYHNSWLKDLQIAQICVILNKYEGSTKEIRDASYGRRNAYNKAGCRDAQCLRGNSQTSAYRRKNARVPNQRWFMEGGQRGTERISSRAKEYSRQITGLSQYKITVVRSLSYNAWTAFTDSELKSYYRYAYFTGEKGNESRVICPKMSNGGGWRVFV